jgi:hypothetical protein
MIPRRALLVGLAALALSSSAWADGGKVVPAAKVFPFLEAFLKVPAAQRGRLQLAYALRHDGKPATGVKATLVEAGGARIPLPIAGNGRFERLPTLAQLQAKAQIALDAPAGSKFGISLDFSPALKPSQDYDARELVAAVDEANAAMAKAAGPLSLALPDMTGVTFAKAETGVAVFPDGRTQPLPVVAGAPVFRPAQFKTATRVRLSRMPVDLGFYDKKK